MIETSTTLTGSGGSYYCLGGGPGKITFDASSLKTSTAKQSGGGFYMDLLDSIVFSMTPNSNLISCISELGQGGVAYLKSQTKDVDVDLNGPSLINYSKAKLQGGVFVFQGAVSNKLVFGDEVKISNSESVDEEGGIAIFYGTKNYLVMEPKSEISTCTASKNGGCFKMSGTEINDVQIVGNLDYTPKISGTKADSINAAHASYPKNGGFLYLAGRS